MVDTVDILAIVAAPLVGAGAALGKKVVLPAEDQLLLSQQIQCITLTAAEDFTLPYRAPLRIMVVVAAGANIMALPAFLERPAALAAGVTVVILELHQLRELLILAAAEVVQV